MPSLQWMDYAVFGVCVGSALVVGLYQAFKGSGKDTTVYLTGNGKLQLIPVLVSMFMSSISGISVMGHAAEMYLYGTQAWISFWSSAASYALSAYLFVPLMYKLRVVSIYKFHHLRFRSTFLSMVSTTLGVMILCIYLGLSFYSPSVALQAVTGLPLNWIILVTGVVTICYSALGGIRAVVINDFIQGFIFLAGLLILLFVGLWKVGGIYNVFKIANDEGRLIFFNMNPDPRLRQSFWISILCYTFGAMGYGLVNQANIQRYCSLPTLKQAKIAMYMQGVIEIIISTIICLIGLVMFAYYTVAGCDPYRSKRIYSANQLVPYFVADVMNYPCFPGLFMSVIYSGALSSASSSMSGLCAVTWKEYFIKFSWCRNTSELNKVFIQKLTVIFFGIIGILLAICIPFLGGHIIQVTMTLTGITGGPALGIAILGVFIPRIGWKGACLGALCGLGVGYTMAIGQYMNWSHLATLPTAVSNCTLAANMTVRPILQDRTGVPSFFRVSYAYMGCISVLTTIICGVIFSYLIESGDSTVDKRTVINLREKLLCCGEKTTYKSEDETIDCVHVLDYSHRGHNHGKCSLLHTTEGSIEQEKEAVFQTDG